MLGWFSLLFFLFVSEHTFSEIRIAKGVSNLWAAFSLSSLFQKRMLFLGGPLGKHRDANMSAFPWAFLFRSQVPLPICMPAPSSWLGGVIQGIGRSASRDPPPTSSYSETSWLAVFLYGSLIYSSSSSVPRPSHCMLYISAARNPLPIYSRNWGFTLISSGPKTSSSAWWVCVSPGTSSLDQRPCQASH